MSSKATVHEPLRPSRRAMVRGAAWTVPVVAVAATAPAYAASACPTTTLAWSALGNGNVFASTTVGAVTVTLTVSGVTNAANNRTISTTATGAQTSNLRFYSGSANGSSQTATFAFTRTSTGLPVDIKNLSFSFLDVDSGGSGWSDNVVVNTGGFGYTIVSPANVVGDGLAPATAFRAANANTSGNSPGTSTTGNVNVSWAGIVNSVSFTYFQSLAATGSPFIGISNMSFQPVIC
ncbi:hypothetical protein EUA93_10050 [Nocardioides oleivorans]|uniref:Uncharacterized protein n=1 Tax=Nocardioides oleivorans TaxID=273676 RepID=A0A4Q2S3G2_9ACTN|nr:hypothetical protein [Nocardioides oleivorans]RYB94653.1 hypothetical protein EUA93_10050 [Nocardioides oleivorans]